MFEEKKYDYNPMIYTDVLKQYLSIHGDLHINFDYFESNHEEFEKLALFVI